MFIFLILALLNTGQIFSCSGSEQPAGELDIKPKSTPLLDLVRKCPGLQDITREQAATEAFNPKSRAKCPALSDFSKYSLNSLEKCIEREKAVFNGQIKPSVHEILWSGYGCHKWDKKTQDQNASSIRNCQTDPDFAILHLKKWCTSQTKLRGEK